MPESEETRARKSASHKQRLVGRLSVPMVQKGVDTWAERTAREVERDEEEGLEHILPGSFRDKTIFHEGHMLRKIREACS